MAKQRQHEGPEVNQHAAGKRRSNASGELPKGPQRCCANCVFAGRPTGRWFRVLMSRCLGLLLCVNCVGACGAMHAVAATSVCRNYRARREPPLRLAPPDPPHDGIRYIALTKGKHAIVDAEDYDRLMKHKWTAVYFGTRFYAQRNGGGYSIMMHREIMHAPKGMVVDHINGNGLDNRKCNLRICTQGQNILNSKPRGKSSRFKGVHFDEDRGKYAAYVWEDGKTVPLGRYKNEVEAARVRDYHAVQAGGIYAWLNFPAEWPMARRLEVYEKARAEKRMRQEASDKREGTRDRKEAISDR
jgi:hypothetical protein